MSWIHYKNVAEEVKKLEGKTLVITDSDNDGLSSGALMRVILQKLGKDFVIYPWPHGKLVLDKLKKAIEKERPQNVIFMDTPFKDEYLIEVAKLVPGKVIYIDHHKRGIPNNLPENLVYFDVRAMGINPVPSTSGIIYRIGKILFGEDFKRYSLLAVFGSLGDFLLQDDLLLRRDFAEAYPHYYAKGHTFTPIFQDLYFIYTFMPNEDKINFDVDNPIPSKRAIKEMSKTVKKVFSSIPELKPIYQGKKLEVYITKGNASIAAGFLSGLKTDKVIIVLSKAKLGTIDKLPFVTRYYKLSIRNQSGEFDVGKLMAECPYKITGGGHPKAGGGLIRKSQLQKFIEFFKEKVENSDNEGVTQE